MKITKCYNCNSEKHSFYAEENGYILVKCDLCSLLFVENRPDDTDISHMHEQGKHLGDEKLNVTGRFNKSKISEYLPILEDLFKGDKGGKKTWLDVGCGHGEFMIAVQKYFSGKITVRGTEPNEYKQRSAQRRGLDVTYFDLANHEEKYDVISLLNVYSHLPDPPAFLKTLKRLLNPNGEIILQTGDTAELDAKDHLRPFYLPNHLSFASESIVVGILERTDFEVLKIKKYSGLKYSFMKIGKEVVKLFMSGYKSKLLYYLKIKPYSHTTMFIRAKNLTVDTRKTA